FHGLVTPVTTAFCRKYFYDVRPLSLQLADLVTELLRCPAALIELTDRSQDTRARQHASRNGFPQWNIRRSTDALHRGEPRHQRCICILCRVVGLLRRRLATIARPAVPAQGL